MGGYAATRTSLGGNERNRTAIPALEELEQRLGIASSRSRANSSTADAPIRRHVTGERITSDNAASLPRSSIGEGNPRSLDRFKSPGPNAPRSSLGDASPRQHYRLKSPEPNTTHPSLGNYDQRPYESFKTPEPDMLNYRRKSVSSGSPVPTASKPTEDAIEEMKRRFMRTSLTPSDSPLSGISSAAPESPSSNVTMPYSSSTSQRLKARASTPSLRDTMGYASSSDAESHTPQRPGSSGTRPLTLRPKTSLSSLSGTDVERLRTPELVSDVSDSAAESSGITTPPLAGSPARRAARNSTSRADHTPTKSRLSTSGLAPATTLNSAAGARKSFSSKRSLENLRIPAPLGTESKCARCSLPLFTTNGGKFVTVPEEPSSSGAEPKVYHSDCFRCKVCDGMFEARGNGQAVFVRAEGGPCHVEVSDGCLHFMSAAADLFSKSVPHLTRPKLEHSAHQLDRLSHPPLLRPTHPTHPLYRQADREIHPQ
jgi:hypothetical protein